MVHANTVNQNNSKIHIQNLALMHFRTGLGFRLGLGLRCESALAPYSVEVLNNLQFIQGKQKTTRLPLLTKLYANKTWATLFRSILAFK